MCKRTLRIIVVAMTVLTPIGDLHAQSRPASSPPPGSIARPPVAGFSVALLLGEASGPSTPEALPVGAAKALADVRDLLPFKSYRLLDAQYMTWSARSALRLRGPGDKPYALEIHAGQLVPGRVAVSHFRLTDESAQRGQGPTSGAAGGTQAAPTNGGDVLIDTSFSMDIGETVVVGTSALNAGRAIVVLVTAKAR